MHTDAPRKQKGIPSLPITADQTAHNFQDWSDNIYIFKIRKLQFCRVQGGPTALTQSLQINFTVAQVQLPILGVGSDCSHCKVQLEMQ